MTRPFLFSNLDALVPFAKARAQRGLYDGRATPRNMFLIKSCAHQMVLRPDLCAAILFTRDIGHHTSGWWKNPDYERCQHLSISFLGMPGAHVLPFEHKQGEKIARAFFGDDTALCWIEGPYSPEGKARDVWHYRLFCDPGWQPFKPRGEVYDRSWTPSDWKSFSEVHGFAPAQEQAPWLLGASE